MGFDNIMIFSKHLKGLPLGLEEVVRCISTLLSEKDVSKCTPSLTPDAYAVIGKRYLPLADAIERRGTAKGLPDEHGWEIDMVHTFMDEVCYNAKGNEVMIELLEFANEGIERKN